jgi:hypothetical protein
MNPFDCGLTAAAFWMPERLVDSAWIEHAPFAFVLVELTEPRLVVELGTHSGYSYMAFCQAIDRLGLSTRCFAVDTWRGDEHAGFYGEEVFRELSSYNDSKYPVFSSLLRTSFAEAVDQFPDGSIDVLHIDGRHFYEDVKEDFFSWRKKLSDRSVVLFHDITVYERGFGVYRFWEELRGSSPHFEFFHAHGLGILAYGSCVPAPVLRVMELSAHPKEAAVLRSAYHRLGVSIAERKALFELQARGSVPEQALVRSRAIGALESSLPAHEQEIASLKAQLAERDLAECNEVGALETSLLAREQEIASLKAILAERNDEFSEFHERTMQTLGVAAQQLARVAPL